MVIGIKLLNIITLLEVTLESPLDCSSDVQMYISKDIEKNSYIFSIPLYNWAFEMENGKNIELLTGPSGFNHPKYKNQLMSAMMYAISIIENK